MRSSWIRAWIAAAGVAIAASAIARSREGWLLGVEEPVMDWVLDGTDTSPWAQAQIISSPWLLIVGTLLMVLIGAWLEWRIAVAVVVTTVMGTLVTQILQTVVRRTPPDVDVAVRSSFPNTELVQTGVFFGLIVLMCWWLGLPRLLWQIVVEGAIVLTLIVAIRLILNGEIWPSDAVGSAIVIVLSLITAALVFESNPADYPWKRNPERSGNGVTKMVGFGST